MKKTTKSKKTAKKVSRGSKLASISDRILRSRTQRIQVLEERLEIIESGLKINGCEIVEKAIDEETGETSGPWIRNIRAEKAENGIKLISLSLDWMNTPPVDVLQKDINSRKELVKTQFAEIGELKQLVENRNKEVDRLATKVGELEKAIEHADLPEKAKAVDAVLSDYANAVEEQKPEETSETEATTNIIPISSNGLSNAN